MKINIRNRIPRGPIRIVFAVIIAGLAGILLQINTAETMSNFIPISKREIHQIPTVPKFKKSIRLRLASEEYDPLIQTKPDKLAAGLFGKEYDEGVERYYIVQFDGPITDSVKYELENSGARILDYLPDFAFIVKMDDSVPATVRSLKGVRWVGAYPSAHRIEPDIATALSRGTSLTGAEYVVTLFEGEDSLEAVQQIEQLGGEVLDVSDYGSRAKIKIRCNARALEFITSINGVKWIEPAPAWKLSNNVASGITGVSIAWNTHNLFGSGQVVAMADTGLDQVQSDPPDPANLHDDFEDGSGNPRVSKIYDRVGDGTDDVISGHGTHVAGSVLGNGALSGSDPGNQDYANSYAGMAPEATLVFQSIENNTTGALSGIPSNLNTLFNQAYGAGAWIHTNSWGSSQSGAYTSFSEDVDQFAWDHKDFVILFSAGNDGVDVDGDGVIDLNSMQSPATAKNCIAVGASENDRPDLSTPTPALNNTWGWGWPSAYPAGPIANDHVSDNAAGVAAFSSRGPCLDGRIKPDILAPGTNIVSTKSTATTSTLWGSGGLDPSDIDYYTFAGGTSMSAPLVAGAATLVRQYYTDLEAIAPSAALIKATLLNGAADITPGQYGTGADREIPNPPRPNNVEGWGRVDLENSIFPVLPRVLKYVDEAEGLATNESIAFDFAVTDGSEPLKATLVWSDYPGSPVAGGGLVNDLDVSIIGPSGAVYYPNNASQRGATEVIYYDDGSAEGAYVWIPGNRVAVRFTPTSYPAKLDNAVFLLGSSSYPNTFSFYVYNGDDAAGPQQVLASGTTTMVSGGWHVIDLSDFSLEIGSGDFFVAIELNANLWWYIDNTSPRGRSWDYADGKWTKWPNDNYMFRAVVASEDTITSYDRINNVVGIDIGNPAVGSYSIYVEGYNIPQGPQPYALVVSGGNLSDLSERRPPISPKDVTAHAISSDRIELTWSDRSTDEDGFEIEKKVGPEGTYSQIDTVDPDVTDYVETEQDQETMYSYRVRAFNAQGDSSYFNESMITTHAPPTDLSAAAASSSSIRLSWSDNSSYESVYEIWRKDSAGSNFRQVGTAGADMTSYVDTNLSASTAYYYQVRAHSTNSVSYFSNEAAATTLASGGGGGGGGCFIAISAGKITMAEANLLPLLVFGIVVIGAVGLKKRLKK